MDKTIASLASSGTRVTNQWVIVGLLLVSVCINYIDRGSLSVAAPLITKEFTLSPHALGYLLSAFFWSYTVCQLITGLLVDRWDVKWVYAGGFFLWSMAMAITGLVHSFATLFAARLLLGVGESVFLPSASKVMVNLFSAEQRGLPNAVVDVGTKAGPGLSLLIGGLLITQYGWRALFIGIGLASLLWLLPWWGLMPRARGEAAKETLAGPTVFEILSRRETWGTSLGMFALGYVWIFLLTWLPTYLVTERGFSAKQMAVFGSLPYWGMAATSLAGGWASDHLIRKGLSTTFVRKTFAMVGLLLCAVLLVPASLAANNVLALAYLIGSCLSLGLFTSNVWAITQTLAGCEAAGKWTGIQNFIGNLGGVVSPIVAGFLVQRTGSFILAFFTAAGVLVCGAICYFRLVTKVEPLGWTPSDSHRRRIGAEISS